MKNGALFYLVMITLWCNTTCGISYSLFDYDDDNYKESNKPENNDNYNGAGEDDFQSKFSNYLHHKIGGTNKNRYDDKGTNTHYGHRGNYLDEHSGKTSQCQYIHYFNYLPKGRTDVDHIKFLGKTMSYRSCASLCCKYGDSCQLGWLINGKCFGVSCDVGNEDKCQPQQVTSDAKLHTILMKMKRSNSDDSIDDDDIDDNNLNTINHSYIDPAPSNSMSTTESSSSVASSSQSNVVPVSTQIPHKGRKSISVAVDGNKDLQLPENHVKIFANTWPLPTDDNPFYYQWKMTFGPSEGNLEGVHDKIVSLTGLVAGSYGLKVLVYDKFGNYGFTNVNVTVHPEPHVNKPPHIMVSPSDNVTISSNDKLILDASKTTDDGDDSELQYEWVLINSPIQGLDKTATHYSYSKPVLSLPNLKLGSYLFKLTVTDNEGLSSVANVNINVKPVVDYPPTANAGESLLIHLPHNEVTLDASESTDDKGIVEYSWKQLEGNQVEMKGIKSSRLHVGKLDVGYYQFQVEVKDTTGQASTATVSVDVQKENNQPPVAMTTGNVSVSYPKRSAVLNGTLSSDDYKIIDYKWTQIAGPTDVDLQGQNKPILHVDKLHIKDRSPTTYVFQLTVTDYRNLTNSTIASIDFHKGEDVKPRVNAGPDVIITYPQRTVALHGVASDGFGIKSYKWTKSNRSPAAGNIMDKSDETPSLILSDLINGTYNYTLTVTNNNGLSNSDTVKLTVKEDPNKMYLVQIYLDVNVYSFNQQKIVKLGEDLIVKIGDIHNHVIIQRVVEHDQHLLVEFYVTDRYNKPINGSHIYNSLIKDGQGFQLGEYTVIRVEEGTCQNPCSFHGFCDLRTKRCICSTFWVENPFVSRFGQRRSNCDWSILYIVLIVVGSVVIIGLTIWLCCCCCMHRRKEARRKRIKYAILDHKREDGQLKMFSKDNPGYSRKSLLISESETEEEILYDTKKNKNNEKKSLIQPTTVKNNLANERNKKLNNTSATDEEITAAVLNSMSTST